MNFKEEFLHFVWKYKHFDHRNLLTVQGETITIEHYGHHNFASGPDFLNGRIKLNDIVWVGNIELHKSSSDWDRHRHYEDKAYDNVVLHVVYKHDKEVFNSKNQSIPTLVLNHRIDTSTMVRHQKLQLSQTWVPCENQLYEVDSIIHRQSIDRALTQRLERKSNLVLQHASKCNNDWNNVLYMVLGTAFGAKLNRMPFEHLTRVTPLSVILKNRDNLMSLEALLIGQAGLLGDVPLDGYHEKLMSEYNHLKLKYQLASIPKQSWKFSGLRPVSFPIIRVAQFARIMARFSALFSQLLIIKNPQELNNLIDVTLDGYWLDHYNFLKTSKSKPKRIGKQMKDNIVMNAFVPVLFAYGLLRNESVYKDRAISWLDSLNPENNSVIKKWIALGIDVKSAHDSQGLLEIKNEFCTFKKCLQCPIGIDILKKVS